eukprot:CAMPEP_0195644868 /NCGR_PEP_ID=MMETSP0815-20121206/28631_1 /TAXON_ID=97485 /ORGANISM="Prymnesium parvum, Strain Texoma1" /LENGTH=136 /DNA_ID=CAMNT_0040788071 /DNA_START=233 /DNA_END=640 /DNA_ORIENTATION=-
MQSPAQETPRHILSASRVRQPSSFPRLHSASSPSKAKQLFAASGHKALCFIDLHLSLRALRARRLTTRPAFRALRPTRRGGGLGRSQCGVDRVEHPIEGHFIRVIEEVRRAQVGPASGAAEEEERVATRARGLAAE